MVYDLAIIGAGFAGLAAFKKAKEQKKKVCLIAEGQGASQFFSGVFDVVDSRWQEPALSVQNYPSIQNALHSFVTAHPQHLYAQLAETISDFPNRLEKEAKEFFNFYQIPVMSDDRMLCVFGSNGKPKPTGYSLCTHGISVAKIKEATSVVYLDVPGLVEYPALKILEELKQRFENVAVVHAPEFPHCQTSPLAQLLLWMDNPKNFDIFKQAFKKTTKGFDVVFMPPLLGLCSFQKNHQELESVYGARVVELLSATPSTAGLRMHTHIRKQLEQYGPDYMTGKVVGADHCDGIIQSVKVKTKNETTTSVRAQEFILATGKYLGGGIQKQRVWTESVFGLPLWVNDLPVSAKTPVTEFLQKQGVSSQPFMFLGIRCDEAGCPVDHQRQFPVYKNLKACGHVLTGFDFTRERCGFGVSLGTAMRCFL